MGKFERDWRWGEKSGVLEHKSGSISETRKDMGKVTMEPGGPIAVSYTHLTLPTKRIV